VPQLRAVSSVERPSKQIAVQIGKPTRAKLYGASAKSLSRNIDGPCECSHWTALLLEKEGLTAHQKIMIKGLK
jgi:hypothetical protein